MGRRRGVGSTVEIAIGGGDGEPRGIAFVPVGGRTCQVVAGRYGQARDLPVGEQMLIMPKQCDLRVCAYPIAANLDWIAALRVSEDSLHLRLGRWLQLGESVWVGDADGEQTAWGQVPADARQG